MPRAQVRTARLAAYSADVAAWFVLIVLTAGIAALTGGTLGRVPLDCAAACGVCGTLSGVRATWTARRAQGSWATLPAALATLTLVCAALSAALVTAPR